MARLEIKFSDRVGSYHVQQAEDGFKHEDVVDAPKLSNLVYRKIFDQILKSGNARVEITSFHNSDIEKATQERWDTMDDGGSPFEKEIDAKYDDENKDFRERQFRD